MIVPDFAENCFLQPLHFQIKRVLTNDDSCDSHHGQVGLPEAQRNLAKNSVATRLSAKQMIASWRVVGIPFFMFQVYGILPGVSS